MQVYFLVFFIFHYDLMRWILFFIDYRSLPFLLRTLLVLTTTYLVPTTLLLSSTFVVGTRQQQQYRSPFRSGSFIRISQPNFALGLRNGSDHLLGRCLHRSQSRSRRSILLRQGRNRHCKKPADSRKKERLLCRETERDRGLNVYHDRDLIGINHLVCFLDHRRLIFFPALLLRTASCDMHPLFIISSVYPPNPPGLHVLDSIG